LGLYLENFREFPGHSRTATQLLAEKAVVQTDSNDHLSFSKSGRHILKFNPKHGFANHAEQFYSCKFG